VFKFLSSRAALAATVLIVLQGALIYSAVRPESPPSGRALSQFPASLGSWTLAQEGVIDADTQAVLKADDLLNRFYSGNGTGANLFVAAFRSQRNGKAPHSPKNCLPGSGWTPADVLLVAKDEDVAHVGAGKTMFVREGCWWCHTLLPEETQDWQVFGAPPALGDFNGESPTAFGSDRKAPDLLHVGSRNSSREWMMMHFFNPRLVQTHSIMPRFDYLWGDVDATGKKIDFDKWRAEYLEYHDGKRVVPPDVPQYAKDSEIRYLIDYILSLK